MVKQLVLANEMTLELNVPVNEDPQETTPLSRNVSNSTVSRQSSRLLAPNRSNCTLSSRNRSQGSHPALSMATSASGSLLPSMNALPTIPPTLRGFDPSGRDPIGRALGKQTKVLQQQTNLEAKFTKRRQVWSCSVESTVCLESHVACRTLQRRFGRGSGPLDLRCGQSLLGFRIKVSMKKIVYIALLIVKPIQGWKWTGDSQESESESETQWKISIPSISVSSFEMPDINDVPAFGCEA